MCAAVLKERGARLRAAYAAAAYSLVVLAGLCLGGAPADPPVTSAIKAFLKSLLTAGLLPLAEACASALSHHQPVAAGRVTLAHAVAVSLSVAVGAMLALAVLAKVACRCGVAPKALEVALLASSLTVPPLSAVLGPAAVYAVMPVIFATAVVSSSNLELPRRLGGLTLLVLLDLAVAEALGAAAWLATLPTCLAPLALVRLSGQRGVGERYVSDVEAREGGARPPTAPRRGGGRRVFVLRLS